MYLKNIRIYFNFIYINIKKNKAKTYNKMKCRFENNPNVFKNLLISIYI